MANFLFKKSYKFNHFTQIPYNDLWGSRGVFTTIRVYGETPKFILLKEHLSQLNTSLIKMKINFFLTQKKLLELIPKNLKIKKYNHLLRIAIKKNIISISLRPRLKLTNNFNCKLVNYQRTNPKIKNLQYKKILLMQKGIDMQKMELLFFNKNKLLEGSTTNIIMIKNNNIILPKGNYYKGITLNFLLSIIHTKYIFKPISISELSNADEIILVGSGKGVIKVTSIPKIKWYSSNSKMFKRLSAIYKSQLI